MSLFLNIGEINAFSQSCGIFLGQEMLGKSLSVCLRDLSSLPCIAYRDRLNTWVVGRMYLWDGFCVFNSKNGCERIIKYIGLLDAITMVDSV